MADIFLVVNHQNEFPAARRIWQISFGFLRGGFVAAIVDGNPRSRSGELLRRQGKLLDERLHQVEKFFEKRGGLTAVQARARLAAKLSKGLKACKFDVVSSRLGPATGGWKGSFVIVGAQPVSGPVRV